MKIQDRDIEIINYIEKYGATIQQIADLYFSGSYESANKRLRKLEKDKFIKGNKHPVLNKKVYYENKIPSFHSLVIQEVYILNKNIIQSYKREAKLDRYKVDALFITNKNNIIILEVDLFNKTKKNKIDEVKRFVKLKLNKEPTFVIINKSDLNNKEKLTFENI